MNKNDKLELIRLTANHLKEKRAQSCKNYRILSQEPLFRGITCEASIQYHINAEEIEREVSKTLNFEVPQSSYGPKSDNGVVITEQMHLDECLSIVTNFKPEEVSRLPIDAQKRILKRWVDFKKGQLFMMEEKFYKEYAKAVKTVNSKTLESVSELQDIEMPELSTEGLMTKFEIEKTTDINENSQKVDKGKKKDIISEINKGQKKKVAL